MPSTTPDTCSVCGSTDRVHDLMDNRMMCRPCRDAWFATPMTAEQLAAEERTIARGERHS